MYFVESIVQEVIQLLRASVDVPVCILSPEWEVWDVTDESHRERWDRLSQLCSTGKDYREAAKQGSAWLRPWVWENQVLCYIGVEEREGDLIAAYADTLLAARYSAYIRNRIELTNRRRSLLANQLAGAAKSDLEIESYFQFLNCSRNVYRCAVLCTQVQLGEGDSPLPDNKLCDAMERWGQRTQTFSGEDIYGLMNNRLLIFKSVSAPEYACYGREVEEMVRALSGYVQELTGGKSRICACAGSAYDRADQLYMSYNEANYLCSNLEFFMRSQAGCLFINDFIFEYLYSKMDHVLQKNMIQDLRFMLEASPALSETAIALVGNENSPVQCAKKLGVHRNTVLQRIQKMKNEMALDPLHDIRDSLALNIYALQKYKKTVWNAGIIVQPDSVLYQGLKHLSSLLYERSGGTFQLNLHTVSTSGDNNKLFRMLMSGSLDLAVGSTIALRHYAGDKVSVLQLPCLFSTEEEAEYVLQRTVLPEFKSSLEKSGLLCLDIWSMGWRYLTSKGAPIRVPEDLRGRRIRILASDHIKDYFLSLGAVPLQIYYNNIREALASNMIDCQENPYANILDMEFYKYQDYVTEMKLFYSMEALCLSMSSWKELEEDRQEMLRHAISESSRWMRMRRGDFNEQAKKELIQKGMTIVSPSQDEMILWKETINPLYKNTEHKDFLMKIQRAKKQYMKP